LLYLGSLLIFCQPKKNFPVPGIRRLFTSEYTANVIAHHGELDKGMALVQKPFSMVDMTEKVREVLDMAPDKN
jgi:hypothetical protein